MVAVLPCGTDVCADICNCFGERTGAVLALRSLHIRKTNKKNEDESFLAEFYVEASMS
jgi:hypothetical protein